MSHLNGPDGGRAAIVDVDDLKGSQVELQSARQSAHLRFTTHKNRNNQPLFGCLDGASQR
jgi:hypothetical protein